MRNADTPRDRPEAALPELTDRILAEPDTFENGANIDVQGIAKQWGIL